MKKQFFRNRTGQTATEYMLVIATLSVFMAAFATWILGPRDDPWGNEGPGPVQQAAQDLATDNAHGMTQSGVTQNQ